MDNFFQKYKIWKVMQGKNRIPEKQPLKSRTSMKNLPFLKDTVPRQF